jgi:hypothetical protein
MGIFQIPNPNCSPSVEGRTLQAPLGFKTFITQKTAEAGEEFLLTPFLFINIAKEQKISHLFSSTSSERQKRTFFHHLFSTTSRDYPSYLHLFYFRTFAPGETTNWFIYCNIDFAAITGSNV